jgi:hypothetical protein
MNGKDAGDFRESTATPVVSKPGSSIGVTFDMYGHLFPCRGKEGSFRCEKSMADGRVGQKAEFDVSSPVEIAARREGRETN